MWKGPHSITSTDTAINIMLLLTLHCITRQNRGTLQRRNQSAFQYVLLQLQKHVIPTQASNGPKHHQRLSVKTRLLKVTGNKPHRPDVPVHYIVPEYKLLAKCSNRVRVSTVRFSVIHWALWHRGNMLNIWLKMTTCSTPFSPSLPPPKKNKLCFLIGIWTAT